MIYLEENIFGQNLRKLRKTKGLSLDKLGIELGVTGSAISSWELGNKEPNFDMAKKLQVILWLVLTTCSITKF